jgi:O-antigen ligase
MVRFSNIISWPFVIFSLFTIAYSLIATIVPANRDANAKLFWSYLVNYVIVGYSIRKPSQLVLLIDIWLISVGYSSLHGFFQGGIVWGNQWLADENQYAVLMAMALPLNCFLFQSSPSRLRKLGYLSLGGLNVAGIVLSLSRTGIVTIVTIGLFILTFSKRRVRILLMGVLVIMFVIALAPQEFFKEADKLWSGEKDSSVTSREFFWDAALKMFYTKPLFGVGPVNFSDYLILYDPKGLYGRLNWKGTANVAHSTPLTFLSETGIIGSLLILSVQFTLIRNWRKVRSKEDRIPGSSFSTSERMVFSAVSNAVLIAQAGFWAGSLFITLNSWPFYYCLVSFSEAVKNAFAKNTGSDDEVS